MTKLFFLLILFVNQYSFSQKKDIPKIEFTNEIKNTNRYVRLLDIKDKNALIIKITLTNSHYKENEFISKSNINFIVFNNNGSVSTYSRKEEYGIEHNLIKESKTIKRKIRKKNVKKYWEFLTKCVENNRFKIDNNKLNIFEKELNNKTSITQFYNGTSYSFEILKNDKYNSYSSVSPREYIENKFPGYKERKKLIDLVVDFENLMKEY